MMAYKKVIVPNGKQQRITIPKELELEAGKEIVILYLDDYNNLKPEEDTDELNKKILDLESMNKELVDKLDEKDKIINKLAGDIEEKDIKLATYDKDKAKLTKLEEFSKNYVTIIEKVIATNENITREVIDSINDEYKETIKNSSFMDRLFKRITLEVDLNKYKDNLKEAYKKELDNTKANIYYLTDNTEEIEVKAIDNEN